MKSYSQDFEKWWYEPLENSKDANGNYDKDMLKHKDYGKDIANQAWRHQQSKIQEMEKLLEEAGFNYDGVEYRAAYHKLLEVVKFYANKKDMYECAHESDGTTMGYIPGNNCDDFDRENGRDIPHFGARARKILKELGVNYE